MIHFASARLLVASSVAALGLAIAMTAPGVSASQNAPGGSPAAGAPAPPAGQGAAPGEGRRGGGAPGEGRGRGRGRGAANTLGDGPWDVATEEARIKVTVVARGLDHPWELAFLPGGAMLVTERPGRLRVIRNGVLDPAPIDGVPEVHGSIPPHRQPLGAAGAEPSQALSALSL